MSASKTLNLTSTSTTISPLTIQPNAECNAIYMCSSCCLNSEFHLRLGYWHDKLALSLLEWIRGNRIVFFFFYFILKCISDMRALHFRFEWISFIRMPVNSLKAVFIHFIVQFDEHISPKRSLLKDRIYGVQIILGLAFRCFRHVTFTQFKPYQNQDKSIECFLCHFIQ